MNNNFFQQPNNQQFNTSNQKGSCGCQQPKSMSCCPPPQPQCKVINRCFYEDINHVCNFHTHIVNTCVKRHHYIPNFTQSEETVVVEQCGNQPNIF